jgi:integrase
MWLDIPPGQSKNHRKRTIRLTVDNLEILQEMRERLNNYKSVKICSDSYNKVLTKALKRIGASEELTLHNLRHTFGCIRRLQTNGNMPLIRDEMGHTNFSSTERYTVIPLKR